METVAPLAAVIQRAARVSRKNNETGLYLTSLLKLLPIIASQYKLTIDRYRLHSLLLLSPVPTVATERLCVAHPEHKERYISQNKLQMTNDRSSVLLSLLL